MIPHRPPNTWLSDLQKAKIDAALGTRPKITIVDVVERINAMNMDADANASEAQLIPNSPRSVEACLRLGIDPVDLAYKPVAYFKRPGEDMELVKLRYDHFEAIRQDRLNLLLTERKRLVEEGGPQKVALPGGSTKSKKKKDDESTSEMVEKERQRLEVLKRRQEKELQQMVQYEQQRKELLDKQQKKIDEMERRAAELQRQKAEHDAQWAVQQRERELVKKLEEEEREREAKRLAQERYRREQEMQRREAAEARRRTKEAMQKEMERRQKADEARRETERILAEQEEQVRIRKLEMERRDKERHDRLQQEAIERAAANQAKRKKAEERITTALGQNRELLRKKREDFELREQMNERRRLKLEEQRMREEERKRELESLKGKERHEKYQAALEHEEIRKETIKKHAEDKDKLLQEVYHHRHRENSRRRIEKEIQISMRLDKVDSMRKMQAWQRQQLFEKIMDENEKTAELLSMREDLQMQRKMANMQASLNRHAMNQAMDQLRTGKGSRLLEQQGIAKRPATAFT